jgi:hypothetical protein
MQATTILSFFLKQQKRTFASTKGRQASFCDQKIFLHVWNRALKAYLF